MVIRRRKKLESVDGIPKNSVLVPNGQISELKGSKTKSFEIKCSNVEKEYIFSSYVT